MKFHEINSDNLNIIDAYDQNSVTIKNNTYKNGVIIFPEKIITKFPIKDFKDLNANNLHEVFKYKPELILIGSNLKNKILDKDVQILFIEKNSN